MKGIIRVAAAAGLVAVAGCHQGLQVETMDGSAGSLERLQRFAVVAMPKQAKAPADVSNEGLEALKKQLRERVARALEARGYVYSPLERADLAFVVDAGYRERTEYRDFGGSRTIIGLGTRTQTGSQGYYRQLIVSIDFVDLRRKSVAWRIVATGKLGETDASPEIEETLALRLAELPQARAAASPVASLRSATLGEPSR